MRYLPLKDIPIFTTPTGTASLILREIPYQKTAYVLARSVLPGGMRPMLSDCLSFCVQAGAERVWASAEDPLDFLPHVHDMLELSRPKASLPAPEPPVDLAPLTVENFPDYRACYNRLFAAVPNAATCREADAARLLSRGSAFLARVDGALAGIGELDGGELRAVGVLPKFHGLGYRLTLTLLQRAAGPDLFLRCSSANERALRLYDRLGFHVKRVVSRWYSLTG